MSRRTLSLRGAIRIRALRAGAAIVAASPGIDFVDAAALSQVLTTDVGGTDDFPLQTVTDGNLIILTLHIRNNNPSTIFLTNTGWTAVTALTLWGGNGAPQHQRVWYKFASSEPGNITIQNDTGVAWRGFVTTVVFSGVHADVFDVTPDGAHTFNLNDDSTPLPDALTSVTDAAMMVLSLQNSADYTSASPPTGYDSLIDSHSVAGGSHTVASKLLGDAGLETPGDWTINGYTGGSDNIGFSLMLKPA